MTALAICSHCHQPLPPPVYKVGRLRMDTGARRVYELNRRFKSGEREIRLQAQLYDLLAIMMRRPGMAFDVETLADQIETDTLDPFGLITTRICQLRKKLPAGAAKIETMSGAHAYRLVP